jgi:hypothetical protein
MLSVTMGSAPPSSGQEILKSGRRNSRGELHHAPLRTSTDTVGSGDGPAAAHVGFNP